MGCFFLFNLEREPTVTFRPKGQNLSGVVMNDKNVLHICRIILFISLLVLILKVKVKVYLLCLVNEKCKSLMEFNIFIINI